MRAVFYDLETSDKNFVGQILNYCFLLVDENLNPVSELCGDVRISRLQLPSPGAVLANRIRALEHQESADDEEFDAAQKIARFLASLSGGPEKVILIGYNSSRFDLPYLRTTLIRNGMNPYFGGRLICRDLLFCSKKLSVTSPDFPRAAKLDQPEAVLSLSLENLSQRLGLLEGRQSHHSRDDVYLSIKLARAFREFGLDPLKYTPYEALEFHSRKPPVVLTALYPEYDLTATSRCRRCPYLLLSANHRASLWVDLDRYESGEGRASINWCNTSAGSLIAGGEPELDGRLTALAARALEEFKGVTPDNFFPRSSCDIEQDIYRLDMQRIEVLSQAILGGDRAALDASKDRDVKVLYARHRLGRYRWSQSTLSASQAAGLSTEDNRVAALLRAYADYRYGGKLQLSKSPDKDGQHRFHQPLRDLWRELQELKDKASPADAGILTSLEEFYLRSDLFELWGREALKPGEGCTGASNDQGSGTGPLAA